MATPPQIVPMPSTQAPMVDADGKITSEWLRYFLSLQTAIKALQ
jgi:hypothetical protein